MDLRSPINITTREEYWPALMNDLWFTRGAYFSRLRETAQLWHGGRFIRSVFRFRPMAGGGHYKMGAVHTNTKVPTIADGAFELKFFQQPIVEYKEELQVFNKGDNAIFSILDEDLSNGLETSEDHISYALFGSGNSDDSLPDGLSAMIGDGVLPSWNGDVIDKYAGISRADFSGGQMSGNIMWFGGPTGKLGDINFPKMERLYRKCCRGNKKPNLILSNHLGFSMMINKLEPQYRFEEVTDPMWGGDGYKFHSAYVMVDEHCPTSEGLDADENFDVGDFKTGTITNPVTVTKNGFPIVGNAPTLEIGEPIFVLNTDEQIMRLDDDPEYAFGFSGFLGNQDSERVVGRIKVAYALQGLGSRYNGLGLGAGG